MSTPALQALLPEVEALGRPLSAHSDGRAPARAAEAGDQFLARLRRMTPSRRVAVYQEGGFSRHERAIWASRYPEEVPMVNDEFEWLALASADLD
ncbi:MAG: hypothetical protein R2909_20195 [Gemmatimonadales bacterium]